MAHPDRLDSRADVRRVAMAPKPPRRLEGGPAGLVRTLPRVLTRAGRRSSLRVAWNRAGEMEAGRLGGGGHRAPPLEVDGLQPRLLRRDDSLLLRRRLRLVHAR